MNNTNYVKIEGKLVTFPVYNEKKKFTKFLLSCSDIAVNHITGKEYVRFDYIWVAVWDKGAKKASELCKGDLVQVEGSLRIKSVLHKGIWKTKVCIEASTIKCWDNTLYILQYRNIINGRF